eukprot:1214319-Pleurochrysis_carterae.AAC.1
MYGGCRSATWHDDTGMQMTRASTDDEAQKLEQTLGGIQGVTLLKELHRSEGNSTQAHYNHGRTQIKSNTEERHKALLRVASNKPRYK